MVDWLRGRGKRLCARVACPAWVPGPSTSPLEGHLGEISAAKSSELTASFNSEVSPRQCTRLSCGRLRLAQPACACGDGDFA